jgi:hypothetical protein
MAVTCDLNKFNSNGIAADGCESANECPSVVGGTCVACSDENTCTTLTCDVNKFNLNGNAGDGCETGCPTITGGTCTACTGATTCTALKCNTNTFDINGDVTDGCENTPSPSPSPSPSVNTTLDATNPTIRSAFIWFFYYAAIVLLVVAVLLTLIWFYKAHVKSEHHLNSGIQGTDGGIQSTACGGQVIQFVPEVIAETEMVDFVLFEENEVSTKKDDVPPPLPPNRVTKGTTEHGKISPPLTPRRSTSLEVDVSSTAHSDYGIEEDDDKNNTSNVGTTILSDRERRPSYTAHPKESNVKHLSHSGVTLNAELGDLPTFDNEEKKDNVPPPLPPKRVATAKTCKVSPPLTPRRRSTGGSSIEVVVSTGTTESEELVEKSTNPFDDFF